MWDEEGPPFLGVPKSSQVTLTEGTLPPSQESSRLDTHPHRYPPLVKRVPNYAVKTLRILKASSPVLQHSCFLDIMKSPLLPSSDRYNLGISLRPQIYYL